MRLVAKNNILTQTSGMAVIEFALLLPILLLIFFGMFEVTRLMLVHQKLDKTVNTITDLVAQNTTITQAQIKTLFDETSTIMQPLSMNPATDDIIITSVTVDAAGNTTCLWQRSWSGSQDVCGATSPIGPLPPALAANIAPGQAVIIGVVTYEFNSVTDFLENLAGLPVVGGGGNVMLDGKLTKSAIYIPRLSGLVLAPS